jgi:GntR family transcriptional regulator, transcriptional repressor for pyruvate dehydrogenase complex
MKQDLFTRNGKAPSNVDTVVSTIKNLLIRRQLKPGDLIPSENYLSEALSISRGSIREAMKILSALGVIEIRQGDGTYICTSANKTLFDPLLFSVLVSDPDMDELAELRVLIECGIVDLAIKNASDEEIGQLSDACSAMEKQAADGVTDVDSLLATDMEYHRIMGQITKNQIVDAVYDFVMGLFAPTMRPGHGLESHRRIVDSVQARDLPAAVAAVEEHDRMWEALNRDEDGSGRDPKGDESSAGALRGRPGNLQETQT